MAWVFAIVVVGAIIAFDYIYRQRIVVEFGVLGSDPLKGDLVRVSTREIPFRPGDPDFRYGPRFFKRSGRTFKAMVVHLLPSAPSFLHGDLVGGTALPDGRYRIEGKELEYPGGGVRALRFSADDPVGEYELQLYVNGALCRVIRYTVLADAS